MQKLHQQTYLGTVAFVCSLAACIQPSWADPQPVPTANIQPSSELLFSQGQTPRPSPGTITIREITFKGDPSITVFSDERLREILNLQTGQTVSERELQEAVNRITQSYINGGYLTSQAELTNRQEGNITITIRERGISNVRIEGNTRLQEYVRSRIAVGLATPLNTNALEEQLRLLRNDPLIANIEASLRGEDGGTILSIRVTDAEPLFAAVGVDNYSPPSVGSERFVISAGNRNLLGLGDELSVVYNRTILGGAEGIELGYRVPLNGLNGTVQLRTSWSRNRVIQEPFAEFDIRGQSELYELTIRQPIARSFQQEFAISLGLSYQDGQTFTFAGPTPFGIGPAPDGTTRTTTLRLGQDFLSRDNQGIWSIRSTFNLGLGIFDATINPRPIPDGRFFSWLGQIQRLQVLGTDHLLLMQGDVQLSANSLLPPQQLVIGGGQSVRGFRQNARAGDNGARLSVEHRWILARNENSVPSLTISPFLEGGWVWNNPRNPNTLGDQNFLAGAGLGLLWQPVSNLSIRLDYGVPLVRLNDRGDNAQDRGFYFNINYQF